MSDAPYVGAKSTPSTVPAYESDLLAEIYRFILQCGEERRAIERSQPGDPDDAKEIKNDCDATEKYTG